MYTSKDWIQKLKLLRHPEGGFYKEVYRSTETISHKSLPKRFNGNRSISTSIYFLLENDQFSSFHRLESDEIWHFYAGSPLIIHIIASDGSYRIEKLGLNIDEDQRPQITIPTGTWFAAEVIDKSSYSLIGCTVAPGFDFDDFELAERKSLINHFPHLETIINKLTR